MNEIGEKMVARYQKDFSLYGVSPASLGCPKGRQELRFERVKNFLLKNTSILDFGCGFGDLSGYTLTFTAQEAKPANFIASATSADPYAGMTSATVTVTVGTNS